MDEDNTVDPSPRVLRLWTAEDESKLLQLREANPFQQLDAFVEEALTVLPNRTANAIKVKINRLKNHAYEPSALPIHYASDVSSLQESEISDTDNNEDQGSQIANGDHGRKRSHEPSTPNNPADESANGQPKRMRTRRMGKRQQPPPETKRKYTRRILPGRIPKRGPLRKATVTTTARSVKPTSSADSKTSYDNLLENIEFSDWARILNDARDSRTYKAQAEKDRRDTLALIDKVRTKDLELRRLKDTHQHSSESSQPISDINVGVQAAWSKMMDILPKNVPSFYWESTAMKEAVAEMKGELGKLNKAAGGGSTETPPNASDKTDQNT